MKKNLLTLALIGVSYFANAQVTYLGDAAKVTVSDNTLLYSGGGFKLVGTAQMNVVGDVMVSGSSGDSFEVDNTSDFRLKNVSATQYGQLYITGIPQGQITGKVNKEYAESPHGATGRQQVALPFYNYSITDLQSSLPHINIANSALTSAGRWNKRSVFKWNNVTAAFDQLTTSNASTSVGKATDYYILSRRNYDGSIAWDPTVVKTFKGVPVSDQSGDTSITLTGALSTNIFGANGTNKNSYNELYNSYLDDPFVTSKWANDYGLNVYQQGNPFLTNIDLSYIKKGTTASNDDDENYINNLNGIYYYTSGIQNGSSGTTYTSATGVKITFDGSGNPVGALMLNNVQDGGDITSAAGANYLVIKPMQEFIIKLSNNNSQSLKFNKTRRFSQTARTSSTYSPTAARTSALASVTKQLAVILYDSNDIELGRTFYVVNNDAVTGYAPQDARLQAVSDNVSIYTKEEQINGGADNSTTYGLQINEANEDNFSGKEIPLVVNNSNASKLKFYLIEGGNLLGEGNDLSNGKSFYFSKNGVLTKLSSGSVVPVENTSNTFGLYYEQPSGTLGSSELINGQTIVVKKDTGYIVRFNKNWKFADIDIYSSAGQLLHSAKNVSAKMDYSLPINYSVNGVYIIKVKSDDGEIVTKKIIK